jgi:hypothetical protein
MDKLIKSLLLGIATGILNAIPMAFQDLSWQAHVSVLLHWLALSVIITYARLPLSGWLSGLIIALLTSIPMAIMITATAPSAALPILFSAVILGSLLGLMTEKLITDQRLG